ncbi:replication initiation protein [Shewanella sp. SG44-6]|jgi:plasmid replication initiation protein|uniref:replication initiation protein n=1 Tax=Shewanella sp. SG44-6 TaxID=2760959 RepID=UPI001600EA92|nr:replication initiation protein [Shewanella sp. SG44-6]MBB1389466.1 replication initiation protein [Shewanella sp. SG44-6]
MTNRTSLSLPENDLVRFSNELIKTPFNLNKNERLVILFSLSSINGYQPNPGKIKFSTEEFADKLQLIKGNEAYKPQINRLRRTIKQVLNDLLVKTFTSEYIDNDSGKLRERKVNWLNELDSPIDEEDGDFIIEFSSLVEPFLFNLKSNYSEFQLAQLPRDKDHALSINFLLLKGQYLKFDWLSQKIDPDTRVVTTVVEISSLKNYLGLGTKYADWRDFRKRVLTPAVDEINLRSKVSVNFENVLVNGKTGRIRFLHVPEIVSSKINVKPLRPKLVKRKRFIPGSHAEGAWKKENFTILIEYRKALKTYDPKTELAKIDLERLHLYSEFFSRSVHDETKALLADIAAKSAKRKAKTIGGKLS